ncbi:hypothetical protein A3E39_04830 [Candidatus Uhrbacteria bacterium RIFCSPHIGHO2_12_FULL_60_25]|uniref:Type 4 fimbrial biogenesis protein PilX N-terminal domain-containing protein n=1 Tax=Candidatus Uhrbacteria bacterium RIFCSPHIGHO2_12_FULL_60_25 TaxID=1802399 RepID=A0A1F7ULM8_9BACT|nr:MAG: hypothetical protein A3E39_04830 [Candidatus Uhrbacteria bacterium RIFCSPHIGHO2_12_FULL_60_25]
MSVNARGNILPLALVIMSSILLAGIGLGIVVLDSIRRSADTDASMVAYYAADAGIERQLYDLRKKNATIPSLAALNASYGNGSSWVAQSSGFLQTLAKNFSTISKGDFQFVDLFDPDNVGLAGGVTRVDWSWEAGSDCGGGPPEVELGYAKWLSGGSVLPQDFTIVRGLTSPQVTTLDPTKGYRLRFRPKGCAAANLKAEVSPGVAYAPMAFPGDITIGSTGAYKKTTQAISVQAPRQDILSGVFSYVIFSECQLIKDPTNPAPPCP